MTETIARTTVTPAATRSARAERLGSNRLAHVVLIIGSLVMMFPFLWQLKLSISTQAEITSVPPDLVPSGLEWRNFTEVFERLPFLEQFWVSVAVTFSRTIGQLVLCSLAGYAFARMSFRFKGLMLALILSILMVPGQVYLIPQYQIVQQLGWLDSIQGIVAPGIFSAFGTFLMMQFFKTVPVELEEAARLDGCNPWQTFWKVVLPVAKPGLTSLAIITVLVSWGDLLWPLVITSSPEKMPLAVGMATLSGYQGSISPGVMMAAALMAMAPILILFVVLQRRVVEGIAFSGLK
ncbi:MAG TPA: carbohydrate ABC transporter permease [Kribbella sp.]|uniref:carbohydrate ABC transporter permease n=1 Tax=Kribbella sp. TaxID=1871183 RepID=UPI002D7841D4|nr:carbohydrate ABC transporter permease [Kribbella sp.]HET6299708.1 carbohydrate ABC transporter permease [Kribbella sp.]